MRAFFDAVGTFWSRVGLQSLFFGRGAMLAIFGRVTAVSLFRTTVSSSTFTTASEFSLQGEKRRP